MVDNVTSNYMIKYTDHEFEAFAIDIKICKKDENKGKGGGLLPENVMIKPAIAKQFDEFMRQGRVLFF